MQRFKRILCFAGAASNSVSLRRAYHLAKTNGATLTIMDVIKPMPKAVGLMTDIAAPDELQELVAKDHERKLLDQMAEYSDQDVAAELVLTTGDPATEVIRYVIDQDIDLVIKTAEQDSPTERLFGSVTRSLLRMCPCPVWVLKPEIHGPFDRVLAAIDLEADDETHQKLNHEILELAFSVAKSEQADLHIVSAWNLWMEEPLRRRAGDQEVDKMLGMQQSKIQVAQMFFKGLIWRSPKARSQP
ncbi:MAG: universal stress protein [Planctomycetota bacterium]